MESTRRVWAARVMTALAVLFLMFDAVGKVVQLPSFVDATAKLGYPANALIGIGILELICLTAYTIPRTAVLGAVLMTGYLGGAVATHVRLGNPLFSHVLFPIYVAALIWGALLLQENRLRALIPVRR